MYSPKQAHPLQDNPKWHFIKNYIGVNTYVRKVPVNSEGAPSLINFRNSAFCRELMISRFRAILQSKMSSLNYRDGVRTTLANCEIHLPAVQQKTLVSLFFKKTPRGHHSFGRLNVTSAALKSCRRILSLPKDAVDYSKGLFDLAPNEVIHVFDAVVGIPALLMDPGREAGDWWVTTKENWSNEPKKLAGGIDPDASFELLSWHGSSNFFLDHPVLLSLFLGFFRQAYCLIGAEEGKKIIAAAPRTELDQIFCQADRDRAYALLVKLRPWLEVSLPKDGSANEYMERHYSIPEANTPELQSFYWLRFMRLCKALERHGVAKVFDSDSLLARWRVVADPHTNLYTSANNGPASYWGEHHGLSADAKRNYQRLLDLSVD